MDLTRRKSLQTILGATAVSALSPVFSRSALAQAVSRSDTMRHVAGAMANGLDPNGIGGIRENRSISMSFYDRLVTFGRKEVPGGYIVDQDNIQGELAERVERSPDGRTFTFHLRPNATWHDGRPVTAADIKWSLDRGVSAKTLAASFFRQASLTSPEQFVVLDDHRIQVRLPQADRLTLPMLCTPFASMYNSSLAKKNAGPDDSWAVEWLKGNVAGSGAYSVERYTSGQQMILRRNDKWVSGNGGQLPYFRRIIIQAVAESATRANLLERGDADIAIDLSSTDVSAILQRKQADVFSVPQFNAFELIAFGTQVAPFDNIKVREAVAAALPYDAMFQAAHYGRGHRLFGGTALKPSTSEFAQPWPVKTNIERAKSLLAEAGHPKGFATSFTFPTSDAAYAEPMAALIKEALGKIGIDVTVQKLPKSQFTTNVAERKLPMACFNFAAYFVTVEYMMRTFFSGTTQHNYSGWKNDEIRTLASQAQFQTSKDKYDAICRRMMELAFEELPVVMLWQPNQDAVMAPDLTGYTYTFHSQVDYRHLRRT